MRAILRRRWLGLLGLTLALAAPAGAGAQLPSDSVVRDLVARRVAANVTPGMVVGLVDADGRTRIVAQGEERPGKPLDARSVFEIGSVSKVFTASILADMAARGEVTLNEPVTKLLPASVKVPDRNGRQITLVDLATQSSGLPRMPNNLRPADPNNPYADYSVQQLYDFLSGHTLTRDIGAQYEYSNLGVGLLGHALALRAGKSYDELLHERILQPLKMTSTGVAFTPEMRARLVPGHARGQQVANWDIPTLAGAGGIRSDLEDMLRFLAANMSPANDRLGRALASTHARRAQAGSPAMSIGLNWHILTGLGDTIVWHNGQTGGYHSFIGFRPSTHAGVVILSAADGGIDDIGFHLLDARAPLSQPGPVKVRKEISLPPEALEPFVGEYTLAPTFSLVVTRDGGQLLVQATGQPRIPVYPESPTDFFYKVVDAQLTFVKDAAGKTTSVVLHQNGRDLPGQKVK